jgi:hypothetical protein
MTDGLCPHRQTAPGTGDTTGARKGLGFDEEAEDGRAVELPGVPGGRGLAGAAFPGRPWEVPGPGSLVPDGNRAAPGPGIAAPVHPGGGEHLTAYPGIGPAPCIWSLGRSDYQITGTRENCAWHRESGTAGKLRCSGEASGPHPEPAAGFTIPALARGVTAVAPVVHS